MAPPAPWDRTAWALAEDAIDLFVSHLGITATGNVDRAKRRALGEIRAQFGPGARIVGG